MSRFMGSVFAACLLAIGTSSSAPAAEPDWPKSLALATASPGGPYYVYGDALAQILTERLGIPVNPLPTQGSIHNLKLLDSGGAQLGLIVMGIGLQGWNGTGDWTNGKSFRNMRALFPMFEKLFKPWSCGDPALRPWRNSTKSASVSGRKQAPPAPILQR